MPRYGHTRGIRKYVVRTRNEYFVAIYQYVRRYGTVRYGTVRYGTRVETVAARSA